jgi:putative ABC transport system permease protein
MKAASLAARNLLRNRRRSAATLLAMIIGVTAVLLFGGYSRSINYGLQTGYVQRGGHLQIQHRDYFLYGNGNPMAYGIPDYERIIDAIRRDAALKSMVTVATPTLQLGGIAGNFAAGVSRTVAGTGLMVEEQNEMRKWNDYHLPGMFRPLALTGTEQDAAVIGTGVARVLLLCEALRVATCPAPAQEREGNNGPSTPRNIAELSARENAESSASAESRIEILAASSKGAPNVTAVKVVKAEQQGVKELDDIYVAMHLRQAQKLVFGADAPKATAIVLQLQHTSQMAEAKEHITKLLNASFRNSPLQVLEFPTLNPSYGQTIAMFGAIFSFVFLLISAIVLFTVGNTMSAAVMERTTEIGTLRAIGLRRNGIRNIFLCEGLILGLVGSVLGVAMGILLSAVINASGLTWTPPGRLEAVALTIRVWGETRLMLGTCFGLLLVAAFSAWWPARRASKLDIVDALRHV